jgi:hypothetical protein
MRRLLIAAFLLGTGAFALFASIRRLLNGPAIARSVISSAEEHTVTEPDGAVRSVQSADVLIPTAELERLWAPVNLERLARTYWRFLTRATLGAIRIYYTEDARYVCLLTRALPLLTFQAPEYEFDGDRGVVRWRIERGLLVSRRGRGGNGFLEIEVQRCGEVQRGRSRVHVEVEVANFYPAIAHSISRWVYANTQSRIHVIVTHSFLRSLARLDLAESKVGRFREQDIDEVPDPSPRETVAAD